MGRGGGGGGGGLGGGVSGRGKRSNEVSCVFEFVKCLQPQALHNHATCTCIYSASGGSSMYALPLYYSIPPPSSIINLPPHTPTPPHPHTPQTTSLPCAVPPTFKWPSVWSAFYKPCWARRASLSRHSVLWLGPFSR